MKCNPTQTNGGLILANNDLRQRLVQLTTKVPESVSNGSVQTALQWKSDAAKALAMSKKAVLNESAALSLISRLNSYR